mgnify:FL=1|tara:strand:+ start:10 stop:504 length:495 start_codon:yes stop_codon:yes gene_type:complete
MNMSIEGGFKTQKELVKNVAYWAADKVLGLRLSRVVDIDYRIRRNLDADGWCIWEDEGIRPREFTIDIRAEQTFPELILTVCHEMVHVRQMARSELKEVGIARGGKHHYRVWKGKKISDDLEYCKQPWETEAYELQEPLAKMFVEETGFEYTQAMISRDKRISK